MGSKEKIATLVMAFFCLCFASSLSPSQEVTTLDHLQGNKTGAVQLSNDNRGGAAIAHPSKFSHASGGRGASSRPSVVCGGNRNGASGSHSPYTKGGVAIIPYAAGAAGAANNRHNYHGNHSGSKSNYNGLGLISFASTILACLLLGQTMQL